MKQQFRILFFLIDKNLLLMVKFWSSEIHNFVENNNKILNKKGNYFAKIVIL